MNISSVYKLKALSRCLNSVKCEKLSSGENSGQCLPAAAGISTQNNLQAGAAHGAIRLVAIFIVAIQRFCEVHLQTGVTKCFCNLLMAAVSQKDVRYSYAELR